MRLPRWLHRVYAHALGYFWLPCPLCGRMFGGHEIGGALMLDQAHGRAVCRLHPGEYGIANGHVVARVAGR